MDSTIIVSLITFAGTLIGTFSGIIVSTKVTNVRLEQLEKKVDKHNNLVERTYAVESRLCVLEGRVK